MGKSTKLPIGKFSQRDEVELNSDRKDKFPCFQRIERRVKRWKIWTSRPKPGP